jgi:hypothetical protein
MSQHVQGKRTHSGAGHHPRSLAGSAFAPPARSGGRALEGAIQAEMGARFGHDFSQVRVHTDAHAGEDAEALGAKAYTRGSDIVFGGGQWTPGSPATERLLAHELTHVVQQARSGPGDPARVSGRGDASEREARFASEQVVAGKSVQVEAVPDAAFARDDDDKPGFHGGFLPPKVGYNQPMLGGMTDFHLGMGGLGADYKKDNFHLESGFSPMSKQASLAVGVGAPLLPWQMDVDHDLGGMSGGINSAMNGGGIMPNLGAIGAGVGTLGDIAGAGGPTSPWGFGIQAQASPEEKRVMAGFRLNL